MAVFYFFFLNGVSCRGVRLRALQGGACAAWRSPRAAATAVSAPHDRRRWRQLRRPAAAVLATSPTPPPPGLPLDESPRAPTVTASRPHHALPLLIGLPPSFALPLIAPNARTHTLHGEACGGHCGGRGGADQATAGRRRGGARRPSTAVRGRVAARARRPRDHSARGGAAAGGKKKKTWRWAQCICVWKLASVLDSQSATAVGGCVSLSAGSLIPSRRALGRPRPHGQRHPWSMGAREPPARPAGHHRRRRPPRG